MTGRLFFKTIGTAMLGAACKQFNLLTGFHLSRVVHRTSFTEHPQTVKQIRMHNSDLGVQLLEVSKKRSGTLRRRTQHVRGATWYGSRGDSWARA